MAKELLKDTTSVVVEKLVQSFMPQLNAWLDGLQQRIADTQKQIANTQKQIAGFESRMDKRFDKVDQKFERQQELISELGLRVNSVGAKLDAYVDITKTTQSEIHHFLERLVRVEEAQKIKRRRAS